MQLGFNSSCVKLPHIRTMRMRLYECAILFFSTVDGIHWAAKSMSYKSVNWLNVQTTLNNTNCTLKHLCLHDRKDVHANSQFIVSQKKNRPRVHARNIRVLQRRERCSRSPPEAFRKSAWYGICVTIVQRM